MESITKCGGGRSIPYQMNLLDRNRVPTRRHNLFFAALPPTEVAQQISETAAHLCAAHALRKTRFDPSRIHVSLQGLGAHVEYPVQLARYALNAASRVSPCHFEATFDHVMSFGRRSRPTQDCPLVLVSGDWNRGLTKLHRALAEALHLRSQSGYTPHVTLLYDDVQIEARRIEPITWTIGEFVLIHSTIKEPNNPRTPYVVLGRWQLR